MTARLLLLLLATGCGATKEEFIQSSLEAGVTGCEVLLLDRSIKTEPGAREWCERMMNGCREVPAVPR